MLLELQGGGLPDRLQRKLDPSNGTVPILRLQRCLPPGIGYLEYGSSDETENNYRPKQNREDVPLDTPGCPKAARI
jgi:hypothetical protein